MRAYEPDNIPCQANKLNTLANYLFSNFQVNQRGYFFREQIFNKKDGKAGKVNINQYNPPASNLKNLGERVWRKRVRIR